jgi:hypothetical protein
VRFSCIVRAIKSEELACASNSMNDFWSSCGVVHVKGASSPIPVKVLDGMFESAAKLE